MGIMTSPALVDIGTGIAFRPDADTILWLPGQDDPQSAVIRDRSGNGNDGTIVGATWKQTSKGLWYLDFDALDDHILIPKGASIDNPFDGGGTVFAVIRADSGGQADFGNIFNKRVGSNTGWQFNVQEEAASAVKLRLLYDWTGGDGQWITTNTVVTTGVDTFVACTYNADAAANNPTFYVNKTILTEGAGIDASTPVTARISDAGSDLYIGDRQLDDTSFDGMIALIGFIKRILTDSQLEGIRQQLRYHFGV